LGFGLLPDLLGDFDFDVSMDGGFLVFFRGTSGIGF
jgi:hypothetical protein